MFDLKIITVIVFSVFSIKIRWLNENINNKKHIDIILDKINNYLRNIKIIDLNFLNIYENLILKNKSDYKKNKKKLDIYLQYNKSYLKNHILISKYVETMKKIKALAISYNNEYPKEIIDKNKSLFKIYSRILNLLNPKLDSYLIFYLKKNYGNFNSRVISYNVYNELKLKNYHEPSYLKSWINTEYINIRLQIIFSNKLYKSQLLKNLKKINDKIIYDIDQMDTKNWILKKKKLLKNTKIEIYKYLYGYKNYDNNFIVLVDSYKLNFNQIVNDFKIKKSIENYNIFIKKNRKL